MGRTKTTSEAGSLVLKRGGRRNQLSNAISPQKTGFDGLHEAPWRKTPSIFKQPVTLVHTTSRETQKAPTDLHKRLANVPRARDRIDKPRPIFWAKSLEGLRAMIPVRMSDRFMPKHDSFIEQHLELPPKLEPTNMTAIGEEGATATLCTSIQLSAISTEITGQPSSPSKKDSNSTPIIIATGGSTAVDCMQPFVQKIPSLSEQDIASQERRVLDARKRLQELRKSFTLQ